MIKNVERIETMNECGVKYVFERKYNTCGRWLSDKIIKISSPKPKLNKPISNVSLFSTTTDDE